MNKYVELLLSMCTSYLMNKITKETFLSNLEIMLTQMKELKD
jgi:hypothetical protein